MNVYMIIFRLSNWYSGIQNKIKQKQQKNKIKLKTTENKKKTKEKKNKIKRALPLNLLFSLFFFFSQIQKHECIPDTISIIKLVLRNAQQNPEFQINGYST